MGFVKKIIVKLVGQKLLNRIKKKSFTTSHEYWEKRYLTGGNLGAGSYNNLAKFKAEVINHFVNENNISSVIEFGCGDGNQLSLFNFTSYIGYDVSNTALEICREKFKYDTSKQFKLMVTTQGREEKNNGVDNDVADLTLSLDVIYHLVEDDVYENYMQVLFSSSRKFVIVYASNMDKATSADHVRHRNFGNYVKEKHPTFDLIHFIPNKYQYSEKEPDTTSFADFYIYKRK